MWKVCLDQGVGEMLWRCDECQMTFTTPVVLPLLGDMARTVAICMGHGGGGGGGGGGQIYL